MISIRPVRAEDADAIAALLRRSIREVCAADYGNDKRLLDAWCSNKTAENMTRWMENADNYFIAAEDTAHSRLAGVGLMTVTGTIHICYLSPEYLHQGVGSLILNDLLRAATAFGLRKVTLESTRTARDFYKRHGFIELGETSHQGTGVPGYKMERDLGSSYA